MAKYIAILLIVTLFSLEASTNYSKYTLLGIDLSQKHKNKPKESKKKGLYVETNSIDIKIKSPKRVIKNSSISKIFQYTKFKKISENKSLCGICMDYKISNRVKLSIDILAQINREDDTITIEDKKANIKVAMYL